MDFRGASAESLEALTAEVAQAPASALANLGAELSAVAGLLRVEGRLRRMVTDPSLAAEAKQGMARDLFGSKIGKAATGLVASAFGRRWTAPKDLPNALERLSEVAIMKSAGKDTARVADELFAFSRTIADNRDLRAALTDPGRSVADRAGLVETLLKGKAHKATITLAKQSLAGGYRDPSSALAEYQLVAAQVQGQGVATVRVARPLADDHAARLAAALQARAGHPVHLNVIVDPEVLGGISVAIGDDVIDGTVSTRLAAAGRQLAG